GYRLGRGESLDDILGGMHDVAEGVKTAQAVRDLASRHGVEMPIAAEVHAMLVEGRSPRTALENLMSREPKPEDWS
ncbi:MAG TPA: NAD(P)H-dependent glycerol-3-phosphate dehydrogenase, partial [Longimicrobiales bacterium]|nr:NAD(P)H-dependent glycerol-3-phosphate dehydrogenase [Longimicrobiales bacterium]